MFYNGRWIIFAVAVRFLLQVFNKIAENAKNKEKEESPKKIDENLSSNSTIAEDSSEKTKEAGPKPDKKTKVE